MRRIVLALAVCMSLVPVGAEAEPQGCVAAAAVDMVMAGSCRYVATGPGTYEALTVNQWRIEVFRGGSWHFFAGAAFPAKPSTGTLPTVAGDLVNVAIMWPTVCTPANPNLPPPSCHPLARGGVVRAGDTA